MAVFNRLEPRMTEAEELSYAHRNLPPRLQLAIPTGGAVNLNHLEQLAVAAEKAYRLAKPHKPPPTPKRSLLPNLAYRELEGRNMDRRRENTDFLEERVGPEDRDWNDPVDHFFLSQEFSPRSTQKPQMKNPTHRTGTNDPSPKRVSSQNTPRLPTNPFLPTRPTGRREERPTRSPAFLS